MYYENVPSVVSCLVGALFFAGVVILVSSPMIAVVIYELTRKD